jgi:hypothetical protein
VVAASRPRQSSSSWRYSSKPDTCGYTIVGKPMTPEDPRRLLTTLVDIAVIEVISNEMRIVTESEWPELAYKLPPRR